MSHQLQTRIFFLLILATICLVISPFIGISLINPLNLFNSAEMRALLIELRLPRCLAAFCVGAILALVGLIYQTALQNPLASPFTLGISSAAALGASFATWFGLQGALFQIFPWSSITAFSMCLAFIWILAQVAKTDGRTQDAKLIIMGILLSYFLNSLLLLLQYIFDYSQLLEVTRWLMGSVVLYDYYQVAILVTASLLLLIIALFKTQELDLILLGPEISQIRGLDLGQALKYFVVCTSLALSIAIAICGPIGFIGIIIPHAAKRYLTSEHKYCILGSWLLGGSLLLLADMAARIVIPPYELPVGILTALIGTPVCALVLLRTRRT